MNERLILILIACNTTQYQESQHVEVMGGYEMRKSGFSPSKGSNNYVLIIVGEGSGIIPV